MSGEGIGLYAFQPTVRRLVEIVDQEHNTSIHFEMARTAIARAAGYDDWGNVQHHQSVDEVSAARDRLHTEPGKAILRREVARLTGLVLPERSILNIMRVSSKLAHPPSKPALGVDLLVGADDAVVGLFAHGGGWMEHGRAPEAVMHRLNQSEKTGEPLVPKVREGAPYNSVLLPNQYPPRLERWFKEWTSRSPWLISQCRAAIALEVGAPRIRAAQWDAFLDDAGFVPFITFTQFGPELSDVDVRIHACWNEHRLIVGASGDYACSVVRELADCLNNCELLVVHGSAPEGSTGMSGLYMVSATKTSLTTRSGLRALRAARHTEAGYRT